MYHPDSPIGRWQRAALQTQWEGVSAVLNALGNVAIGTGAGVNNWSGQGGGFWQVNQPAPPNVNWNAGARNPPAAGLASAFQNFSAVTMGLVQQFYGALAGPGPSLSPAAPLGTFQDPVAYPNSAAFQIVNAADAFLASVPDGGALLSHLVENVALTTGYDEATVTSVVLRNFESNGLLVWRVGVGLAGPGRIVAHMKMALHRLGYEEIRQDYPLTGIPERRDRAALLAFDCEEPVILCYPVSRGQVADPLIREAALFQAGAVSPRHRAHFVWVSDCIDDFFYNFNARVVISHLPARRSSFREVEP
jgi:hypothetical protein